MASTPVVPTQSDRILHAIEWVLFLIVALLALIVVLGVIVR